MTSTIFDNVLYKDSFSSPEMRAIFDDKALIKKYIQVEVALAKAQSRLGIIPIEAAEAIAHLSKIDHLDLSRLKSETEVVGYPILPLVHQLNELCGQYGGYIHWGATTQDIMDTANVLQIKEALALIESDLNQLASILAHLSEKYKFTAMAGRTHLQQALPCTFGYKSAIWLGQILRHLNRLKELKPRVLVGELGGAVGTLASLGEDGLKVQAGLMKELGLSVPLTSWHVARDSMTEVVNFCTLVTGTLGKVAYDVMLLSMNEVGEVYEPFVKGRGASSTMPQKRNAISSELIFACAKGVRQSAGLMIDAQIHDLERATGPWHAEWIALPEAFLLTSGALKQAKFLLDGLVVDEVRMLENLKLSRGCIVSEAVMMALAQYVGHQLAHEWIYEACREVNNKGSTLASVLKKTRKISEHLSDQEIDRLCDPTSYVGLSAQMVDKVLEFYKKQL